MNAMSVCLFHTQTLIWVSQVPSRVQIVCILRKYSYANQLLIIHPQSRSRLRRISLIRKMRSLGLKVRKNELCPDILVESEKNFKDLEKILLQRALLFKDERIRNLESKLADLNYRLQEFQIEKQGNKTSYRHNNITIINNAFSSNYYFSVSFTLLLVIGVMKFFK